MSAGLLRAALRLFAFLPLPLAHALGATVGWLGWLSRGRLRRVTEANLALCFPERTPAERRRLGRRSLMEAGKTLTEMGAMWLWPPERAEALVREVDGDATARALHAGGRGVIALIPHLGCWEICNLYFGRRYPLTALYRPPRMAALRDTIHRARERVGARLVPTTASGVKALHAALAAGEVIGVLPDQDPGRGAGVFAPFFGIPTNTMTLVARLAQRSGAPVVIVYGERLPRGRGYRIHLEAVDEAIHDPDPVVSATVMNAAIERLVRRCPEQYQWSYKRFKTRPAGQSSPY